MFVSEDSPYVSFWLHNSKIEYVEKIPKMSKKKKKIISARCIVLGVLEVSVSKPKFHIRLWAKIFFSEFHVNQTTITELVIAAIIVSLLEVTFQGECAHIDNFAQSLIKHDNCGVISLILFAMDE